MKVARQKVNLSPKGTLDILFSKTIHEHNDKAASRHNYLQSYAFILLAFGSKARYLDRIERHT